jgi:CRISPR-associated protein Csb1
LSLAGLRKLRFPLGTDGRPIERERRRDAETAARTAIAALGVAALAYQVALDYDLRSRCLLVPTHEPRLELLGRTGGDPEEVRLDRSVAASLLTQAAANAAEQGLGWAEESLRLEPTPKLIELIKRSRAVTRDEVAEQ